jgi:uncharacterized damage-inducible protein DinB
MRSVKTLVIFVAVAAFAAAALAQAPPPAPTGWRADCISDIEFVGKRLVDLAEKMPADKYGWRPAPGVRSVSEVYMHVVNANYGLPSIVGAKVPEGFDRGMEKTLTDKAKVVDWLKKSIENAKAAVANMPDSDLDKMVKVPFLGNRELTQRRILMIVETHLHEHLGQSIAYARMNGVTPPWSEDQPAPAKKS